MENEHDMLVEQYLFRHFDDVHTILGKHQVDVLCYLDNVEYRFPFYTIQYYNANPYDIVNSIWEYIITNI